METLNCKKVLNGKSLSVPLSAISRENCLAKDETVVVPMTNTRRPLGRTWSALPSTNIPNSALNNQLGCAKSNNYNIHGSLAESQSHSLQFNKANSLENMYRDARCPHQYQYLTSIQVSQSHQLQPPCHNYQPELCHTSNLHNKLQRQLTLNPAGSDPRLHQMQKKCLNNYRPEDFTHRPLAPSISGPDQASLTHQVGF